MSNTSIIPAHAGWWTFSVSFDEGDKWAIGEEYEVLAWHIEPIESKERGVEDFITHPVTIYGTLDADYAVARSPSGRWYSPDVAGAFGSLENLVRRLKETHDSRLRRRSVEDAG